MDGKKMERKQRLRKKTLMKRRICKERSNGKGSSQTLAGSGEGFGRHDMRRVR